MIKDTLNSIMNDLNRASKIGKNQLYEQLVQEKIDASYESYEHTLKVNLDYLLFRDSTKVLKTIKREKRKEMRKNNV